MASERRPLVEVTREIASIEMDVAHDHRVGGVAEDLAQTLDLPSPLQVLGRERMAELVRMNGEADELLQSPEHLGDALDRYRLAVLEHEQGLVTAGWPATVQVAGELALQVAADGNPTELCPLAPADLEKAGVVVLLNVLQNQSTQLGDPHPGSEKNLERHARPAGPCRADHDLLLRRRKGLQFHLRDLGGTDTKQRLIDRVALAGSPVGEGLGHRVGVLDAVLGEAAVLEAGQVALQLKGGELFQRLHPAALFQIPPHLLAVPTKGPGAAAKDTQVEQPLRDQGLESGLSSAASSWARG